jgi:hypothetical protein
MNEKDLSEYRALKKEIADLSEKIDKIKNTKRKHGFGVDVVTASSKTIPYSLHPVTISGYGADHTGDSKKYEYIKRLSERRKSAQAKFDEIQDFIDSIDNSELRQIVEYRFIHGLLWNAVANKVYDYPCGDRARMTLKRFFEKI